MLECIHSGKHPSIIGPVLIHQKVDFSSFNYFASTLVSHDRYLSVLMAFGTDGNCSLIEALAHNFPNSLQLRCFIHLRKNIQEKLKSIGVSSQVTSYFLTDIFGRQTGTVKEEGLVDSSSEEEFEDRLAALEIVWNKREEPFTTASGPQFYSYFCQYVASVVKHNMSRYVREAAGLGSPPEIFTTNSVESVNSLLKQKVNYKESEWPAFNNQSKELVESQRQEVIRALSGRGEYRLCPEYHHLSVDINEWTRMRPQQRKDVVKAFDNANLKSAKSSQPSDNHHLPSDYQSANYSQPSTSYASISISSDDSGITTIPIVVLQDMWRKAGRLIADGTAVTPAPGSNPKSKMVLSSNSSVPHFVQYKGNGHFVCDSSCLHWKSSGIELLLLKRLEIYLSS